MTTKWFLLKTTEPTYALTIAKCEVKHKESFPNNELGIRLSADGKLALVKVCMTSDDIEDLFPSDRGNEVLADVYTEETHGDAVDLVNTPEWTVDEGDYHGE